MDRIQQMQVFIQVVDSGNFTRAAEVLGLPRSTVSSTVQALEDRLGVQILQRTTRVVRPTQEGLQFADAARDLVDAFGQAEGQFRLRPDDISGRLRIDMPSRIARRLVIPHLQDFRARYPAVTLEISATDRMIDLVSEGIDAVVRLAVLEDSELICRKIGDVAMLTCAGAEYLAEFGVPQTPADLAKHHLVNYALRMPALSSGWDGLKDGREITVAMQSHLCVDNAESYVAGGLHGHGLIQVPAYDVADDIAAGRLVEVLSEFRPSPVPISILYARRRHLAPRLRAFMDWLEEVLRREGVVKPSQ
ncbi:MULTISPECIES: LysR family transcriptional regulator [Roseobacteraceae]|uniref:LysR family transcriptional regulator n=1 Tax=Roseobacteraceae TaxID=2854170 RepID=UPI00125ECF09|nr:MULTISPECIES: LysR family transcriptional regulator [Roseobacteraceae]KAB6717550.1 LysR family transcriptional regulator [Roseobacter sp. TSBP12]|tara:strand:+ start:12707 stop:13621 length:915 start_codon:yes stop_codon:yes gene_type:complete